MCVSAHISLVCFSVPRGADKITIVIYADPVSQLELCVCVRVVGRDLKMTAKIKSRFSLSTFSFVQKEKEGGKENENMRQRVESSR